MSPATRAILLALSTSVLLWLAAPGTRSCWPLAWVALVPLFFACRQAASGKEAFRLGFLAGLLYHTLLLYWILIVLGRYGRLPLVVTVPALLLLAAYMGLYLALFATALHWLQRRGAALWSAPILWVGLDFIRGCFLTGFPWQDLGYSQFQAPFLIQSADLGGHHTVTFLIVLFNGLLFTLLGNRTGRRASLARPRASTSQMTIALILLLAAALYSGLRYRQIAALIPTAPTLATGLIQGNIDQFEKWLPAIQQRTVRAYLDLSEEAKNKEQLALLIWPETALPFFPADNLLFPTLLDELLARQKLSLLTGAPHYTGGDPNRPVRYHNSAFFITPDPEHQAPPPEFANLVGYASSRYDKQHLVPFGEYIPFQRFLPAALPLVESLGSFTPGTSSQPIACQNAKIGVLICFESIFPELAQAQTAAGANLLVNLTNDAWYGRSSAPWQQLAMAVFRAVENKRTLARAANTGISAFIDPLGRLLATTPLFVGAYLTHAAPLLETATIYTRFGHGFGAACALAAGMAWCGRRRLFPDPG